jgi:8-oxo-dGTP pyrophosphatase MutT (NUDIX family)
MYPGIWQIITGKIDANEKAIDAALRELGEETGISPVGFWVVPHVTTFYSHQSDTVNHIPFFAAEAAAETDPRLSPEHDAFEWVNFGETQRRIVWPGQQEGVRIVHQYIVGDEPAAKLTKIL